MQNRGFFVNLDNNLSLFEVSDKLEWAVNNESMDFWKEEISTNSTNIFKNKEITAPNFILYTHFNRVGFFDARHTEIAAHRSPLYTHIYTYIHINVGLFGFL